MQIMELYVGGRLRLSGGKSTFEHERGGSCVAVAEVAMRFD